MQSFLDQHSDRLSDYQLPIYSPDFNSIEKLWKKVKQDGTHLLYFPHSMLLSEKSMRYSLSLEIVVRKWFLSSAFTMNLKIR